MEAPPPAEEGQRDEEQSHQLAPHAITRRGNWDSAGIHTSGAAGGAARLSTASKPHMATEQGGGGGIRQQESVRTDDEQRLGLLRAAEHVRLLAKAGI